MQLYYNFFLNTQAFPSYSQTTTIFDIHPTKKAVTRLLSFCFAHQCSFCIPLSKNKRVTSIFKYFCSEWNEAYFCYKSTLPASTLYALRHLPPYAFHYNLQAQPICALHLSHKHTRNSKELKSMRSYFFSKPNESISCASLVVKTSAPNLFK